MELLYAGLLLHSALALFFSRFAETYWPLRLIGCNESADPPPRPSGRPALTRGDKLHYLNPEKRVNRRDGRDVATLLCGGGAPPLSSCVSLDVRVFEAGRAGEA